VVDTWFSTTCCCCQLESRTLHPTPSSGRIVNHRTHGCGACDFWSGLWLPKKKQLWNRSHEVGSLKKIGLDWRLSSWMKKWATVRLLHGCLCIQFTACFKKYIKNGVGPKPGARRHVNTKVCHLLPRLQIAKFGQKIRLQIALSLPHPPPRLPLKSPPPPVMSSFFCYQVFFDCVPSSASSLLSNPPVLSLSPTRTPTTTTTA